MAWTSPTGFVDSGSVWASEEYAYDENPLDHTCASYPNPLSWTGFLELTHSAIDCDKVRIVCWGQDASINAVDLDVYWLGAWHDIYEGAFTFDEWAEHELGDTYSVTALRINLYNSHATNNYWANINEADFNAPVDVTISPPVASIDTAGEIPTFRLDRIFTPSLATVDSAGAVPSFVLDRIFTPSLGTIDSQGVTPSLALDSVFTPSLATIDCQTYIPDFMRGWVAKVIKPHTGLRDVSTHACRDIQTHTNLRDISG